MMLYNMLSLFIGSFHTLAVLYNSLSTDNPNMKKVRKIFYTKCNSNSNSDLVLTDL